MLPIRKLIKKILDKKKVEEINIQKNRKDKNHFTEIISKKHESMKSN